MLLVVHDTLATAIFIMPAQQGWIAPFEQSTALAAVTAADVPADAFALLPSPECTLLIDTHVIVPDVAVVSTELGAIAMRTPVRPDEISDATVVLYEASATAEVLARALVWPFFGITTARWEREPASDAMVAIVEGAVALEPPEAGFSEDLVRSWFVLTGMPVITHLLVAPTGAGDDEVAQVTGYLQESERAAHARRRDLRRLLADGTGVERERLVAFMSQQRHSLTEADREALVALIVRGAGGSVYPPITRLPFRDSRPTNQEAD